MKHRVHLVRSGKPEITEFGSDLRALQFRELSGNRFVFEERNPQGAWKRVQEARFTQSVSVDDHPSFSGTALGLTFAIALFQYQADVYQAMLSALGSPELAECIETTGRATWVPASGEVYGG
jgi:hypothetical protein